MIDNDAERTQIFSPVLHYSRRAPDCVNKTLAAGRQKLPSVESLTPKDLITSAAMMFIQDNRIYK
jgi:hypothetical protein